MPTCQVDKVFARPPCERGAVAVYLINGRETHICETHEGRFIPIPHPIGGCQCVALSSHLPDCVEV